MKNRLLLGLMLIVTLGALATRSAWAHGYDFYVLPGGTVFPEGIVYDDSTGDFYVSSTTDGTIFKGNIAQVEAAPFLAPGADGRISATGMKVDNKGRLFIAGAATGLVWVYDTRDGSLIARLDTGSQPTTFVNDIAISPSGVAYATDSRRPVLYRITEGAGGQFALETWLDLAGTPIVYGQGFNLGGIAVTDNGRYIIVAQGNVGKLFRITVATKEVVEINLGGETAAGADGILLSGHTLYASRNAANLLITFQMSDDYSQAAVVNAWTHPDFSFPTTIAIVDDLMLVVNSQFDKRNAQQPPNLPFKVLAVHLSDLQGGATTPGMPRTGASDAAGILPWLASLAALALLAGVAARSRVRA